MPSPARNSSTGSSSIDIAAGSANVVGIDPIDNARPPKRQRRWPRRPRRGLLWTLTVVCVLALITTALSVWTVSSSFPQNEGTLPIRGLNAPVTVIRDSYGIPQIYAQSETDLFKAQGYVQAQDRFWEMDSRRHLASGRVAEMFGASYVATDAVIRTLGWRRVAAQEWRVLSPRTRTDLQAYADGVNAWLTATGGDQANAKKSLEYRLLSLQNPGYKVEPWDPVDSLAWMKVMAWDLRSNMDDEMIRSTVLAYGLSRDQIKQLYPPYPYARNLPTIQDGTISNGAFHAGATSAPAAPRTPPRHGGDTSELDRAIQGTAPALDLVARATRSLSGLLGPASAGIGSNSWVVSGALTETGKPILANDPHLLPTMPGIWYQVGLHCECGLDVEGFSLSGVPGVLIGHNARIAWGLTNLGADVSDLYLEKIRGERYFDGRTWLPLRERQEIIKVAGAKPVTITVRATKHGPLLSDRSVDMLDIAARPPIDPSGSPIQTIFPKPAPSLDVSTPGVPAAAKSTPYGVALRWAALEPGHTLDALLDLDHASDWTQFRAAAALLDVPAQNMIYADVDGNIGYQTPGRIPIRGKGDGLWPAPGWDPAYDWRGYIPFAKLPNEFNPTSGVIVSANQPPIGPQYPYAITGGWTSYGYRSERILDLIKDHGTRRKLTVKDMQQIQFDNRNNFAPVLAPKLLSAALDASPLSTVAQARALLKGWDYQQPAESPARSSAAAAFYNATWRHLLMRTFDELPPGNREPAKDDGAWEVMRALLANPHSPWWDEKGTATKETMEDMLVAAMKDATEELVHKLGPDPASWQWGDLHTLTLVNGTLGQSGIAPVEWLFNRGPVAVSGGGGAVNATSWSVDGLGYDTTVAPSMRLIVDLSELDSSRWINLSGESGHAFQRDYTDQVEPWRTGSTLPMRWSPKSVNADSLGVLRLVPG